jgi:epoxide hydrolase-like predicted phosphatase
MLTIIQFVVALMPIKAVVSDFAGVLVTDGLQTTLRKYKEKYREDMERIQQVNTKYLLPFQLGHLTEGEYWKGLLGDLGMQDEIANAPNDYREAHKPIPEMLDFFRALKGQPYKTGLLTNNTKEWFEYFDEQLGLSDIFDVLVSSHMHGVRKPWPKIYHITLDELHTAPKETVFVDDKELNLDFEDDQGIIPVHYRSAEQAIHDLAELGVCL